MARRFRRKPRVLWLPIVGNDIAQSSEENHSANGPSGVLQVAGDGEHKWDQTPLTFDYTDSPSQEMGSFQRSLQDLTSGNAYRLRRIVGKIHIGAAPQTTGDDSWSNVEVACGFIVNKTDDSGNPFTTFASGNESNPLSQDTAQDPWIWRRKWILSPIDGAVASIAATHADALNLLNAQPRYPQTTAGYGSVADGPHIDQKTARIISNQERLFFWIAARSTIDGAGIDTVNVHWHLDVRLLASLRSNSGNRRNASR